MRSLFVRVPGLAALCVGSMLMINAQTSQTFTYSYTGYAAPIPVDSANVIVILPISVPRSIEITKVTAAVRIDYPAIGDLNVYMYSPNGTRTKLLERSCGDIKNLDTSFDDDAVNKYSDACPTDTGRGPFKGNEPLSNFNGQNAIGLWTLAVENNGSDSRFGFVVSFSVTITGNTNTVVVLAPGGVRNAAAPLSLDRPIAPGELISVFGANLGPTDSMTATPPLWSNWMDDTVVRVNGVDTPMRFISFFRIDVQVPMMLDTSKPAEITVFRKGTTTSVVTVPVAAASPGIFTTNLNGTGQAVASNGGQANSAVNPVNKGGVITVFASGLGLTTPFASEGQTIPEGVAYNTIAPVSAVVGGQTAVVRKAVLAPGRIATYAVDIEVPMNVKTGAVEVLLAAGDGASQSAVTIQVR